MLWPPFDRTLRAESCKVALTISLVMVDTGAVRMFLEHLLVLVARDAPAVEELAGAGSEAEIENDAAVQPALGPLAQEPVQHQLAHCCEKRERKQWMRGGTMD